MPVELSLQDVEWPEDAACADGEALLAAVDLSGAELSLLLCDDAFIHALNRDYRGKDRPTDVLAFAQREGEGADPDDEILGDVVISIPTATRQAAARGHSTERELQVLLVHGFLHLLGYDHGDDEEEAEMQAAAAKLLAGLPVR